MKSLKEEIVDNDEISDILNEKEILIKEVGYKTDSITDIKKVYPDENEKFKEASLKYMGKNVLRILKVDFPDKKLKFLTEKLAYPSE